MRIIIILECVAISAGSQPFKRCGGGVLGSFHGVIMHILIALALVSLCAACSAPGQLATASRHPEVTISQTTPDKVKSALVSKMIDKGYRITKDSPYELAFDHPMDNILATVLLGSKYDSEPNARVSYSIAQSGEDVRVVTDLAAITNPGSAFERRTDLNGSAEAAKVQAFLDGLRTELKSSQTPKRKSSE